MRRTGSRPALWVALLFGALAPQAATAADLSIQSELDRSVIPVGGVATLRVTVTAEGVAVPVVPAPRIHGSSVDRLGQSEGFSWINGRVTRTHTIAFAIRPMQQGEYTIPAIEVTSGGVTARTKALVLRVSKDASVPGTRQTGLFARLTIDRTTAYWNEQIVARYTIYVRAPLDGPPIWQPPDASGFWSEPLGEPREGHAVVDGVEYQTSQILVAYFPTRTGRLTIGPGIVHARVIRQVDSPDPWSLLGGSERVVEDVRLETERYNIQVLPLPPGAPDGFRGGVGSFSMDVKIDRKSTPAGEPVTVVTFVRGAGNVASAGDPDVTAVEPARSYATTAATRLAREGTTLQGERRREMTFVPEAPGRLTLRPVRFAWFDPETRRYRTQISDTIRIEVTPPGVSAGDSLRAALRHGPIAAPRKKSGHKGSLAFSPPPTASAIAIASFLGYAVVGALAVSRRNASRDPRRMARERRLAIRRQIAALGNKKDAASRLGDLLLHGLALRYEVDIEGLAAPEALSRLGYAGAPPRVLEEAGEIVETTNVIAYAPDAGGATGSIKRRALALLDRLEAGKGPDRRSA